MKKPDFKKAARMIAPDYYPERLAKATQALREAYAAGLERAAEIAETGTPMPMGYRADTSDAWVAAQDRIAAAIRADREKTDV